MYLLLFRKRSFNEPELIVDYSLAGMCLSEGDKVHTGFHLVTNVKKVSCDLPMQTFHDSD